MYSGTATRLARSCAQASVYRDCVSARLSLPPRHHHPACSRFHVPGSRFPIPNTKHPAPAPVLVGREADLAFLHERLAKAVNGERQIVFVTGEPGIGKTTLIENFVFGVRRYEEFRVTKSPESRVKTSPKSEPAPSPQPLAPRMWVGWGRCIEHYGAGEAYLPILEAWDGYAGSRTGNDSLKY